MNNEVQETEKETNNQEAKNLSSTFMRDSDIKWRAKYKMAREELETFKLSSEKNSKETNERINAISADRESVQNKYIEAKIESMAISQGITDVDIVKLIKRESIHLDEKGQIVGIEEAVQLFKKEKPHFFGAEKKMSSSTNAAPLSIEPIKKIRAKDLTNEEFQRAKKMIAAGKFIF